MGEIREFFAGLWKTGRGKLLLLLAAAGVLLLVISVMLPSESECGEQVGELEEYKARLEGELADFCSSVVGAGRCRVMVSFAEGESFEYKGSTLLSSAPPRVLGVTVLCQGGDSVAVQGRISELISALFDLGKNRICVLRLD